MREESKTVQIIRRSLLHYYPNGFYYKIPDIGVPSKKVRFMLKRPFDLIYIWKEKVLAIEAKTITKNRFNLGSVKDHQLKSLYSVFINGGSSYVVIHVKNNNINKMYFINITEYKYLSEMEEVVDAYYFEDNPIVEFEAEVIKGRINLHQSFII